MLQLFYLPEDFGIGETLSSLSPLAMRLVATVFWLLVTDQHRHSWLSEVYVHTNLIIQINQHSYQQSWRFSLHSKCVCTVPTTDSSVMMFVFFICSLALCWGNVCNIKVTMTFAQLHYFLSQNIGRDKKYYVPPDQKLGKHVFPVPRINSVPVDAYSETRNHRKLLRKTQKVITFWKQKNAKTEK